MIYFMCQVLCLVLYLLLVLSVCSAEPNKDTATFYVEELQPAPLPAWRGTFARLVGLKLC